MGTVLVVQISFLNRHQQMEMVSVPQISFLNLHQRMGMVSVPQISFPNLHQRMGTVLVVHLSSLNTHQPMNILNQFYLMIYFHLLHHPLKQLQIHFLLSIMYLIQQ
jgi:hypothetical protein